MAKCKNCNNLYNLSDEDDVIVGKWCPKKNDSPDIEMERECEHYHCMAMADKIRNMTDEELANLICSIHTIDIDDYEYEISIKGKRFENWDDILRWLESEVAE